MPFKFEKDLTPTGTDKSSRLLILPAKWWQSHEPETKKVKMIVDKSIIITPKDMSDEEMLESILFILKQTLDIDSIKQCFERLFNIKIVEEDVINKK